MCITRCRVDSVVYSAGGVQYEAASAPPVWPDPVRGGAMLTDVWCHYPSRVLVSIDGMTGSIVA